MDFFSALSAPFRLAGALVGTAFGLAGAAVGGALNLAGSVALAPFALARSVFAPPAFFAGSEPVAFQLPDPEATQARVAEVTQQLQSVPRGHSVYTGAPPAYPVGTRMASDGKVIAGPPTRTFNPMSQPPAGDTPSPAAPTAAAPQAPPPRQSAPRGMG